MAYTQVTRARGTPYGRFAPRSSLAFGLFLFRSLSSRDCANLTTCASGQGRARFSANQARGSVPVSAPASVAGLLRFSLRDICRNFNSSAGQPLTGSLMAIPSTKTSIF
ncbi:hypothetical protein N657DRAFT_237357 [Parathielavia appendiculata]|uniref:Uncharacterized protein n=1 Tax=Parathielavia appendiculata TaxID=2587402 RepID=A0AAN6U7R4_9PEZI|nr:hypothetical protein N657DRAFT_237357 [Parathielavia appendiculata]